MLDFSVTFVITIINITILFFILKAVLFKPVTKFMADRAQRVQNTIDQAEKDKADSHKLLEQYKDKLKNAEAEAEQIVKAARKDAQTEAGQIIAEGKAAALALTASAHRQIESERQAAFARFKVEAAALVMAASARLVQREISGDDNRRYAAMLLDELSAQKGKK
ncbi:MAG: ATP synthase F0 subunit B [Treponema sp.]|jgi:F-type H+-transporting ATPase subunit b|nr:ATP synthase F0 subunit B [Treponema sp.]